MIFAKGRLGALCAVAVGLLGVAPPRAAFAQAKVDVQADVVLASNSGSEIDPPELARFSRTYLGIPPPPPEVQARVVPYVVPPAATAPVGTTSSPPP